MNESIAILGTLFTMAQFFFAVYAFLAERSSKKIMLGTQKVSMAIWKKRLILIVCNALLVGGFFGWNIDYLRIKYPPIVLMFNVSLFLLSFCLAINASSWGIAIFRAGISSFLSFIIFLLTAIHIRGSIFTEIDIIKDLTLLIFISTVVAVCALGLKKMLSDPLGASHVGPHIDGDGNRGNRTRAVLRQRTRSEHTPPPNGNQSGRR